MKKVDVQILPKIEMESMASSADSKYVYNVIYFVGESAYEQKIDGIEYKFGELKEKKIKRDGKEISHYTEGKFAKIYKKGTIKLKKNGIETIGNKRVTVRGFRLATIEKRKRDSVYECDARAYVIIDGKKRYTTNWERVVALPLRDDYEIEKDLSADY